MNVLHGRGFRTIFAHATFVATFDPKDFGHVLSDHNWVNLMHEELEKFERTKLGS
jgi:hypothetical protein